ncbi:MAG: DNA glycosylase, partial [Oscillospiraceae bacterium]
MQHVEGAGTRLRLPAAGLDLAQTLGCGQSFRWRARADGGFEGCAGARFARVKCADGALIVEGPPAPDFEAFWSDYFDLGRDYDALRARFSRVDALAPAVAYAGGIHLLRQDGWEALASFILSQNNNIKRISGIIERLCTAFGPPCAKGWSGFPGPERLASLDVEALAPLRAGFRARYLLDAAQRVCSGEVSLAALETLPLPEARAMLMQIVGVGRKVAD